MVISILDKNECFFKKMLSLLDVYKFIDHFDQSNKMIAAVKAQTGTGKSTMFPEGFSEKEKVFL